MKKFLGIMLLLVCVVILSVVASNYVMESRINRYQIVFGEVLYEKTMDVPHNEDYVNTVVSKKEPVCFKLDTLTGSTWIYEDSFYDGTNRSSRVEGFIPVAEGWLAYNNKQKAKKAADIPVLYELVPSPNENVITVPDDFQPTHKKTP